MLLDSIIYSFEFDANQLSVRLLHSLGSLRTAPRAFDNCYKICSNLDLHPRAVVLHLPQHHQDVSHIQGGQCLPDIKSKLPPSLFQPTEFNQLDHKKRFKIVIKSELIVLTICVASFFLVLYFLEPGSLSRWGPMQTASVVTSKEDEVSTMFPFLTLGVAWGLTALMMAVSDFVARVMKPAPTASRPVTCTVGFFTNNIPFLTLNFSIVIGIFVNMVMIHFFNAFGAHGVQISAILTVFLVTNKKARNHVLLRLRQKNVSKELTQ